MDLGVDVMAEQLTIAAIDDQSYEINGYTTMIQASTRQMEVIYCNLVSMGLSCSSGDGMHITFTPSMNDVD